MYPCLFLCLSAYLLECFNNNLWPTAQRFTGTSLNKSVLKLLTLRLTFFWFEGRRSVCHCVRGFVGNNLFDFQCSNRHYRIGKIGHLWYTTLIIKRCELKKIWRTFKILRLFLIIIQPFRIFFSGIFSFLPAGLLTVCLVGTLDVGITFFLRRYEHVFLCNVEIFCVWKPNEILFCVVYIWSRKFRSIFYDLSCDAWFSVLPRTSCALCRHLWLILRGEKCVFRNVLSSDWIGLFWCISESDWQEPNLRNNGTKAGVHDRS